MDSNRVQLAGVREVTIGVTPNTPRMRKQRFSRETLAFKPDFASPDTIRDDRMNYDPILVGQANTGGYEAEFHYPAEGSLFSDHIASAMQNDWTATPSRDNDGTADSVITQVTQSTKTIAFATGAAFVANHLVRSSGFSAAGNNGINKVTTGGATSLICSAASFVDDATPAAAARLKVVGFEGDSGDISATSNGLASTSLDFTTLGLQLGMWHKIGGAGAGQKFATAALNGWARLIGISANALTYDNLPAGWTTDAGTGKTIRVFFGDIVKNGTTKITTTLERGFLSQAVPTYIVQRGMLVNTAKLDIAKKKPAVMSFDFLGLSGSESTTALDSVPDPALDPAAYPIMAGSANVGRLAENGATLASPNWADTVSYQINNNLRAIETADSISPVAQGVGEAAVTVTLNTYFGSDALYAKLLAGTATNVNTRLQKGSQAFVISAPRLTPTDGNPNAGGKNQDVMLPLTLQASYDALTGAHIVLNRLEYFE